MSVQATTGMQAEPGSMMAEYGGVLRTSRAGRKTAGGEEAAGGGKSGIEKGTGQNPEGHGSGPFQGGRKLHIKKIAVLVAVILIPLVYSYFYLAAFWDPYSRLDELPVAIVNMDAGADINGVQRSVGTELADRLVKDNSLKWVLTDSHDAEEGLANRRYYAEINLPESFSKDIASAESRNRIPAIIVYRSNEKRNFLASQVLNRAMLELKTEVSGTLNEGIADQMVVEFKKIPDNLAELNNGLAEMQDGAGQIQAGTLELTDGQSTFNGKLGELKTGLNKLSVGTETLAVKLGAFRDGQLKFSDGLVQLDAGILRAAEGSKSLQDNLGLFHDGQVQYGEGLAQLRKGFGDALAGAGNLKAGSAALRDGQDKYQAGTVSLAAGLSSAKAGSAKLSDGTNQILGGLEAFSSALTGGAVQAQILCDKSAGFRAQLSGAAGGLEQVKNGYGGLNTDIASFNSELTDYIADVDSLVTDSTLADEASSLRSHAAVLAGTSTTLVGKLTYLNGALAPTPGGIQALNAGYAQLDGGVQALAGSVKDAADKAEQLKKGALDAATGAKSLDEGLSSALNGSAQLASSGASLLKGQQDLAAGAETLQAGLAQVDTGLGTLAGKGGELTDASGKLLQGATDLQTGMMKLEDGSATLNDNMKRLSEGGAQLSAGAAELAGGAATAAAGSGKLLAAGGDLLSGEKELSDGALKLKDGLDTAHGKVSDTIAEARAKTSELEGLGTYMKEPVVMKEDRTNPVPDYGTGFAPYFMSLSLWVGALMMYFGIYMDRSIRFRKRRAKLYISEFWKYGLVGIVQAVVLGRVLEIGLHLQVRSQSAFYLTCILVSLCFVSIMQFLIVHLKDVGKFLAILILILQLTSCGGTFPMELVPGFFNLINPLMPMTYSVNALKETISGVDWRYLHWNLLVLGAIFSAFQAASLALFHVKRKRNPEENGAGGRNAGQRHVPAGASD